MFQFEQKHEGLAPLAVFIKRIFSSLGVALTVIGIALLVGIAGYHWIARFSLVDSLLEASMILSGMGPVNQLPTNTAKVFASVYALFSGVIFIGVMGVILSPLAHRMLHKFHLDKENSSNSNK
ncbi:MAG: hypothetical protein ABR555_04485 [Pyrinomonadaceae bacterium]